MYGLVLEGGGARGAYQIGACKAIREMEICIGGVAGTSVGALNGAMLVQNDLDKVWDIWYNLSQSRVIRLPEDEMALHSVKGLPIDDFSIKLRRLRRIVLEGGLDVTPLEQLVHHWIDEDKIRNSPVDYGIVTVDLTDRKPVEIFKENIPVGKLADYIIASATFPGFKLKEIDGRLYIDGGLYNALPINLVRDKGYTDIIVIRTYSLGRKKRINTAGLRITQIAPNESLGPVLDFSMERARRNLEMGYYDALRAFEGMKGVGGCELG